MASFLKGAIKGAINYVPGVALAARFAADKLPEGVKAALVSEEFRKTIHDKAFSGDISYEAHQVKQRVEKEKEEYKVAKGFDTITKGITEASLFPPATLENPLSAKGLTGSIRKKLDEESGIDLILQNGCLNISQKSIQEVQSFFEAKYVHYYTALQKFIANIEDPYFKALKNRLDPIDLFTINAILAERKGKPSYQIELAKKSKFGHMHREKYESYDYLLFYFSIPLHIVFKEDGTFIRAYQEYLDLKTKMSKNGFTDIVAYYQSILDAQVQQQEIFLEEQQKRNRIAQQEQRERNRIAQEERDRQKKLQLEEAEREKKQIQAAKWRRLEPQARFIVEYANLIKQHYQQIWSDPVTKQFDTLFKNDTKIPPGPSTDDKLYPHGYYLAYDHRFILFLASIAYKNSLRSRIGFGREFPDLQSGIRFLLQDLINMYYTERWNATRLFDYNNWINAAKDYLYPDEFAQDRREEDQLYARQLQQQQRPRQGYRYGGGPHVTQKQKKKMRTKTHKH